MRHFIVFLFRVGEEGDETLREKLQNDADSTGNNGTVANGNTQDAYDNGGFEDAKVKGKLQASVSLVEDFEKPATSSADLPPGEWNKYLTPK